MSSVKTSSTATVPSGVIASCWSKPPKLTTTVLVSLVVTPSSTTPSLSVSLPTDVSRTATPMPGSGTPLASSTRTVTWSTVALGDVAARLATLQIAA